MKYKDCQVLVQFWQRIVFSYAEGSTIDSFRVSDFGAFDQPYRVEDAVGLSGSKISAIKHNQVYV